MRLRVYLVIACCTLGVGHRRAFAQNTPAPPSYSVDAAQGPVTGSTRVIGLGGAFVAIAEDTDGIAVNPASVAVRLPYSWNRFDHSFGFSIAVGAWLPKTKFLNEDTPQGANVQQNSLLFGSVGATLYYDLAGFGISAEGQRQALQRSADATAGLSPTDLSGNFGIVHASVAYGFARDQLVIGAGPRVTGVSLSRSSASDLLSVGGVGYQAGFVFKPVGERFRIGAVYKSSVSPSLSTGSPSGPQEVYAATAITLPWQASAGFAYQFGARPLNPPFYMAEEQAVRLRYELEEAAERREQAIGDLERDYEAHPSGAGRRRLLEARAADEMARKAGERLLEQRIQQAERALRAVYFSRPRGYFLITAELLALGASTGSVGFGSFYQGRTRIQLSGENITFSPRLGIEGELIPNWLKLRAGAYFEPTRTDTGSDRIHGTFGFDLKLFSWNVFGLLGDFDSWFVTAAADRASEYLSTSFSIGIWH